jgi:hypothetical protein
MRKALPLLAAAAVLTACGGGENEESRAEATATASETTPSSAARTTTSRAPRTTATPTPSPTLSPEQEADIVASVTARSFNDNREAISTELVKSNGLVEAQTDFRFDEPARTIVLAVTSTFSTATYVPEMAYDLTTDFSQLFWGEDVPDSIRPESLPSFSVTVDGATFVCDGPTMATLADRELSEEMFVQRCGR